MSKKAERITDSNMFYVFVSLYGKDEKPGYHIVPSEDVATYVSTSHKRWLDTPGRGGECTKIQT